jgi:hypothetical protein
MDAWQLPVTPVPRALTVMRHRDDEQDSGLFSVHDAKWKACEDDATRSRQMGTPMFREGRNSHRCPFHFFDERLSQTRIPPLRGTAPRKGTPRGLAGGTRLHPRRICRRPSAKMSEAGIAWLFPER